MVKNYYLNRLSYIKWIIVMVNLGKKLVDGSGETTKISSSMFLEDL